MTAVEKLVQSLTEKAEQLCVTEDSKDLDSACILFSNTLDLFRYFYFNPGEPTAECEFCRTNRALPGAYGLDVYTGDEIETGAELLPNDVYWARAWATRALDILSPHHLEEPCCEEREQLWAALEGPQ
jgi:hypothetical protein